MDNCDHVRGCVCQTGYGGDDCSDDVDECAEDPGICGADNQYCENEMGTYVCLCYDGYQMVNGACVGNTASSISKIAFYLSLFFFSFLYARLQTGRIMVWWCPSIRPSVRVSVRQLQFSPLFSYMLWPIKLKFCMSLFSYVHSIKFVCRQFPSIFVGVMPLLELKILEIHSFPQFSTCFDQLSCHFAYDFILLYYRSSLSVINFSQF